MYVVLQLNAYTPSCYNCIIPKKIYYVIYEYREMQWRLKCHYRRIGFYNCIQ